MSEACFQYPQREQFFFNRFVREMADRALASELGKDVFTLLTIIALQEDCCRYVKPVSFYCLPLMERCGFSKFDQLAEARRKACKAGWLRFVSKGVGSRQAASYFVCIPESDQYPLQYPKSGVDSGNEPGIEAGIEMGSESGINMGNEVGIERGNLHTYPYPYPDTYPLKSTPLPPTEGEAEASDGKSDPGEESTPEEPPPTETMRDVMAAWNALPREFPRIKGLTPARRKSLNARLSEPLFRDNWREGLRKLGESDFCAGRKDGNWKASFDWFVNANNFAKVLEGNYDNRSRASPPPSVSRPYAPPPGANIVKGCPSDLACQTPSAGSSESQTGRPVFTDAGVGREASG